MLAPAGVARRSAQASSADPAPAVCPAEAANRFCPVLPAQPVAPGKFVVYRGRRVYVCCDDCVGRFEARPLDYLALLPQFPADEVAALLEGAREDRAAGPLLDRLIALSVELRPLSAFLVLVLGAHVLAARRVRRLRAASATAVEGAGPPPTPSRTLELLARPTAVLLIAQTAVAAQLAWMLLRPARPPTPRPLAAAAESDFRIFHRIHRQLLNQSAEDPAFRRRLKAVYYRGNDERASVLYNGGNYRTCTFRLSIRGPDGIDLVPGGPTPGGRLLLRLEIERAPFTADGFFQTKSMDSYGLMAGRPRPWEAASGAERPAARVGLTEIEPAGKWEAFYPLPEHDAAGNLEAMIYLGPNRSDTSPQAIVSSAHYAIGCRLSLRDGRVGPESELWMAAVLVAGNFDETNFHEWFGLRPLPELPAAQKGIDHRDLGLDEYGNPIPLRPGAR
jgi:hypothetical protein